MIFTVLPVLLLPLAVGIFAGSFFVRKRKETGVLLFHRISSGSPLSLSQVSKKQFETFCRLLAESKKKTVLFSQFHSSKDEVCVCFDDGHKSVFELAFPILKKFGFKATVFAAGGAGVGEKIKDCYSTANMMSAADLKELCECGWEIASHGVGHLDLTLIDDKTLKYELLRSKEILEEICQKKTAALSFPYGSWNARVFEAAKACGYEKFTAYRKHKFCDSKTIFPSTAVYPFDDKKDLARKISGEIGGLTLALSLLVPHFAKGTPIFFGSKSYEWKRLKMKETNEMSCVTH